MGRIVACIFVLTWVTGCVPGGNSGGGSASCDPGEVDTCPCPDGTSSERICGENDRFGACACGPEGDSTVVAGDDGVEGDGGVEGDATVEGDGGPCTADCTGRVCGDDGCGGSCGECGGDDICADGQCAPPPDTCGNGECDPNETCSTCAEDCACPEGENCVLGACEEPVEGAPLFLTLNSNVRRLTEGEQVTFSAVVTDPDGIDDLIGGVLEDPNGQSYGAFVSSGQEGAYSMTISWGDIHRIDGIEFDGARNRTFVAVFFDQGGLRTRQEINIELWCEGGAACEGACTDLADDGENCGACRTVCDDDATCGGGACACNDGFFGCGNDSCVPQRTVCDRADDCGDGSDEAGCCFADDDCPLGRVCNGDNRCEAGCDDNSRCPAEQQCRDGDCVPGCQRDGDCFENEYCGGDSRCAVGCRGDESCAAGRICEARSCVLGCRDDGGCSAGRICEDESCVVGCRADAACGNGRICVDESCTIGCREDDACDGGQICQNLRCLAGCREDDACGDDQICQNLRCVAGCRQDAACDPDEICRGDRCVPGCQVDEVCPAGEVCLDGQCGVGCNDARPCLGDEVCIAGGCRPGCGADADCAANEYCDAVCLPHVCGDGRLGPDEECDVEADGCSAQCLLEGDFDRLAEGDEPYIINFDGPGRVEVLFRIDVQDDTDTFQITTGGGVLSVETRSWRGLNCEGDTFLEFTRSDGVESSDDDGGDSLCSRLSVDAGDDMVVAAGVHTAVASGYQGRPTGYNLLIATFEPVGVGGDCDPFGANICPAGSYCANGTARCTAHRCGDGVLDDGNEICDDGNAADGDGCEDCRIEPVPLGGPCEPDGPYRCVDGLACHPVEGECVAPVCGDGFIAGDERCEDGNDVDGDGCTDCRFDPFNGDAEPDDLGSPYLFPLDDGHGEVLFELGDGADRFTDDIDYFRFDVVTRSHLEISLFDYPDGTCADTVDLTLYGADGDVLTEDAATAGPDCVALDSRSRPAPVVGALDPGSYVVAVLPNFGDATGPVRFVLDLVPPVACEDGADNDGDGLIDAADPGCFEATDEDEADPAEPPECSDGADNDGDALTDYPDDPDCLFAGGDNEACGFDNIVQVGPEGGQFEVSTAGRPDERGASCAGGAEGGEALLLVTLDAPATVTVEITEADYDTALFTRTSCAVDSQELDCDDDGGSGTLSRLEVQREAGSHYFFVDGFSSNSGTATVEVTVTP